MATPRVFLFGRRTRESRVALATTHHPPPNTVGRGRSTLGHNSNPHSGYNRVAYPYGLPPNYTSPVMQDDAGHVSSPILEGEPPRQPEGMSNSTPRSPSRDQRPTHCLSTTSQHSQYSCPQKDHPRPQKKEGNSISSRRD